MRWKRLERRLVSGTKATSPGSSDHEGISGSKRFKDEIPTLLITLAGAIGQMGHWDEHELRVFLNQCVENWCLQLFLFPHGGNIKIALKSHELLQQRPFVGTRKRFLLCHAILIS
jgi:hypothetical protein